MTAIKAIFCDMDGTLLNPSSRISDFTAQTLKELKTKDVKFIVCTGRPYPDVFATVRKCGLEPDYMITCNGARIHDGAFNLLQSHDIAPEVVEKLVRISPFPGSDGEVVSVNAADGAPVAGKRMFVSGFYQGGGWYTDEVIPEARAAFDEALPSIDLGEALHTLNADKLTGVHHFWFQTTRTGTPEDLVPITQYMHAHYDHSQEITLTSSAPIVLEVVPHGVTKGVAVRWVTEELLGLSLNDVACFGDAWNDAPMLEIAGHPFLMKNAQPDLFTALPQAEVIGTNATDGVATKLRELFF